MNKLQGTAGASGGGVVAGEPTMFPTTTDATMIKIPRPKFTMNHTNGNHKGNSASGGEASNGPMTSSIFQHLTVTASTSNSYPYQEPPVDYWSANNSNSSSNTDLRSITKQLDKDCKI